MKIEKAEREQKDREWKLKMEDREEQRRKEEFQRRREWRTAVGLKEKEATLAQQQDMRLANTELHDQQAQQQAYTALLARLPKFEGKRMPMAFIQSLEKQLKDNAVPHGKWLQALEACLQGKALSSYWTLVEERDLQDYESAKRSVLRCLGPP